MKTRTTILATLAIMLIASTASARPGFLRRAYNRVTNRSNTTSTQRTQARPTVQPRNDSTLSHGQRAYQTAKAFAQQHNLKHFTVNQRGVERIVVNVPSTKIKAWTKAFSKDKCFIEPFFNASKRSAPNWSMLRVGDKNWRQYGTGDAYYQTTSSGRVAFPISLSTSELSSTMDTIKNSRNGSFSYNGGDPHTTGRNCTNWVTYKIGQFTGVTTASVKHHMSSLVGGHHSNRATVMAVMTDRPVSNFGQDQLQMQWNSH